MLPPRGQGNLLVTRSALWHRGGMSQHLPSARAQAAMLLDTVLGERRTLDEALAAHPLRGSEPDNKFAMLLTLTVLRHLGQLDALLANYLKKPLPTKRLTVTNALRLGAAQLLLLDTPAHAAVNETVALTKKGRAAGLAGLVNAVLQKISRERPALPPAIKNVPLDVATRWTHDHGAESVSAIAAIATTRPPLDLHTAQTIEGGTRIDSQMLRLAPDHPPVESLPGYAEGEFFVQDLAASYPARLLGDVKERQVLDLCAAPGGKLMQLIRAGAFVTALDNSGPRMRRVKENLARMNMEANLVTADVLAWEARRPYDATLLDAPCSATGTWRRHPEVLHLISQKNLAELVTLQRAMLQRAWGWVKPGGKLVYCVCSLEREEGEAQAEWFMLQQNDAAISPITSAMEIPEECKTPEGWLRTLPHMKARQGGMDGFFAVCFEKRA